MGQPEWRRNLELRLPRKLPVVRSISRAGLRHTICDELGDASIIGLQMPRAGGLRTVTSRSHCREFIGTTWCPRISMWPVGIHLGRLDEVQGQIGHDDPVSFGSTSSSNAGARRRWNW